MIIGLLLAALAQGEDPEPSLLTVLGAIDVRLQASSLVAVGATPADLLAIARDTEQLPYLRTRATAALGFFDEPAAVSSLRDLALATTIDSEVRLTAVSALGHTAPVDVESVFATVLTETGAPRDLREAAVRATRRLPAPRAATVRAAVEPALAEDDPIRVQLMTPRREER